MKPIKSLKNLFFLGFAFVIPIFIIIIIAQKIEHILIPLGAKISESLGLHSIFGKLSVVVVCILIFIGICLLFGFLVYKGIFNKWSNKMELQLFRFFPSIQILKYRSLKKQSNVVNEFWKALVFKEDEFYRIAFITDESETYYTLYVPDAPKIDAGEVRYFKKENLVCYPITLQVAIDALYNFGKGIDLETLSASKN